MTLIPSRSLPFRNASLIAPKLRGLRRLGRPLPTRIVTCTGVRRGCFLGTCGTPGRGPFGLRPARLRFPPQLRNLIASCFIPPPSPTRHSNGGVRHWRRRSLQAWRANLNRRTRPGLDRPVGGQKCETRPWFANVRGIKMARRRANSVIRSNRWGRKSRRSRLANQRAASSNITASAWYRSENFRVVAARAGVGAPENAYPNEAAPQSRLFAESRRVDRRG